MQDGECPSTESAPRLIFDGARDLWGGHTRADQRAERLKVRGGMRHGIGAVWDGARRDQTGQVGCRLDPRGDPHPADSLHRRIRVGQTVWADPSAPVALRSRERDIERIGRSDSQVYPAGGELDQNRASWDARAQQPGSLGRADREVTSRDPTVQLLPDETVKAPSIGRMVGKHANGSDRPWAPRMIHAAQSDPGFARDRALWITPTGASLAPRRATAAWWPAPP